MAINPPAREILSHSAYQGESWRERVHPHEAERGLWPEHGINSEFQALREVLLCLPDSSFPEITDPDSVQFLEPVYWPKLRRELVRLAKTFAQNGIKVHCVNTQAFANPPPNLIFVRDLFFLSPWGAILGRMASQIRAGEEKWAQEALARLGIPVLHTIRGHGTFEGADALWLRPDLVLVGVGNRTNEEGFRQLREVLREYSVRCLAIPMPREVQHLLGLLQIVGQGTALLRKSLGAKKLNAILIRNNFRILPIEESEEIRMKQGMNLITLKEKTVIMAKDCPELQDQLLNQKICVAATVPIQELTHAAGGIACATGIISRKLHKIKPLVI